MDVKLVIYVPNKLLICISNCTCANVRDAKAAAHLN